MLKIDHALRGWLWSRKERGWPWRRSLLSLSRGLGFFSLGKQGFVDWGGLLGRRLVNRGGEAGVCEKLA